VVYIEGAESNDGGHVQSWRFVDASLYIVRWRCYVFRLLVREYFHPVCLQACTIFYKPLDGIYETLVDDVVEGRGELIRF